MSDNSRLKKVFDLIPASKRNTPLPEESEYLSDLQGLTLHSFLQYIGLDQYESSFTAVEFPSMASVTEEGLSGIGMAEDESLLFLGHFSSFVEQFDVTDGPSKNAVLTSLDKQSPLFQSIVHRMNTSIVCHDVGGVYDSFNVIKVETISNERTSRRFLTSWDEVEEEIGEVNVKRLYHGSIHHSSIVENGFDVRLANKKGMFGSGVYFAENASKANLYTFGGVGSGCARHHDPSCIKCQRKLLICDVILGNSKNMFKPLHLCHAPPGCHSVSGLPRRDFLKYKEFVVYQSKQALPLYVVTYKITAPRSMSPVDA